MIDKKLENFLDVYTYTVGDEGELLYAIDVFLDAIPNKQGLPSKKEIIDYCKELHDFE